jgi:hypothetical protein
MVTDVCRCWGCITRAHVACVIQMNLVCFQLVELLARKYNILITFISFTIFLIKILGL